MNELIDYTLIENEILKYSGDFSLISSRKLEKNHLNTSIPLV